MKYIFILKLLQYGVLLLLGLISMRRQYKAVQNSFGQVKILEVNSILFAINYTRNVIASLFYVLKICLEFS